MLATFPKIPGLSAPFPGTPIQINKLGIMETTRIGKTPSLPAAHIWMDPTPLIIAILLILLMSPKSRPNTSSRKNQ